MHYKIESECETAYQNGIHFFHQQTPALVVSTEAHIHSTIEIILVSCGSFTVFADNEKYKVFAGDMILFRSDVIHRIIAGKDRLNSYYVLKIKPSTIRDLADSALAGTYLLNFAFKQNGAKCVWRHDETESSPEIRRGFEQLTSESENGTIGCDIAQKLAVGSILLGILRSCPEITANPPTAAAGHTADCIYKAMAYINNRYGEDITEAEVSAAVGLSYHYFSRSFSATTGKSFKEYLNMTRINHAERLLLTTDKSVSDICFECGYNDVSYFIKVYKSLKQSPPGKTRSSRKGT